MEPAAGMGRPLRRAIDYYVQAGDISRAIAVATDPHISVEGATDVASTIRQIHDLTPRGSLEEGRLLARMGAAEYFETGDYRAAQAAFARALDIAAAERDAGLELRTLAYATSVDHFDLRWSERAREEPSHPGTRAARGRSPLGNLRALSRCVCADADRTRGRGDARVWSEPCPGGTIEGSWTAGRRALREEHARPAERRLARGSGVHQNRRPRRQRERAATLLHEGHDLSSQLGMRTLVAIIASFRRRYELRLARKPVGLTSRELEILGLLSLGRTNKEIGDALCISSNTVAVHVARVLSKTGSSNRTEAASYAVRHHLIGETRA